MEGHIFSSLLNNFKSWNFPALSLLISGGHTQLYLLNSYFSLKLIGDTVDDTIGECLDKTAVLMGYNYPGGPIIEELANKGEDTYRLTIPKNDKSLIFSFSGLKSEISRLLKKEKQINYNNLSCSLQNVLVKTLEKKIKNALSIHPNVRSFIIGGEVIANQFIRSYLKTFLKKTDRNIEIFIPDILYSTDNAAMIGIRAYFLQLREEKIKNKITYDN